MDNIEKEKIIRYRKEHPKCGYCIYNSFFIINMCIVKDYPIPVLLERFIAKRCKLYKPKEINFDI